MVEDSCAAGIHALSSRPAMLHPKLAALACCASALALLSCAAPKASVVAENPTQETKPAETAAVPEPATPGEPDDGIRLPDMLGLPDEGELRSSASVPGKTPESGAVIARPPSE
jgi:hypothetical protein